MHIEVGFAFSAQHSICYTMFNTFCPETFLQKGYVNY